MLEGRFRYRLQPWRHRRRSSPAGGSPFLYGANPEINDHPVAVFDADCFLMEIAVFMLVEDDPPVIMMINVGITVQYPPTSWLVRKMVFSSLFSSDGSDLLLNDDIQADGGLIRKRIPVVRSEAAICTGSAAPTRVCGQGRTSVVTNARPVPPGVSGRSAPLTHRWRPANGSCRRREVKPELGLLPGALPMRKASRSRRIKIQHRHPAAARLEDPGQHLDCGRLAAPFGPDKGQISPSTCRLIR